MSILTVNHRPDLVDRSIDPSQFNAGVAKCKAQCKGIPPETTWERNRRRHIEAHIVNMIAAPNPRPL